MKEKIKFFIKLFFLFELFLLMNSFALKLYEHVRFYQFDLNNDYMFSQTESSLRDFEIWSLRYYNDVGDNLLILISPIISFGLALLCFVSASILEKTALFKKLYTIKSEPFRMKGLILPLCVFLVIAVIFFSSYFLSGFSENTTLKLSDYVFLLFCCFLLFFIIIIIDIFLRKIFKSIILIKIFWFFLVAKTFFDILFDIIFIHMDSFLYLLIPISAILPYIRNIKFKNNNTEERL